MKRVYLTLLTGLALALGGCGGGGGSDANTSLLDPAESLDTVAAEPAEIDMRIGEEYIVYGGDLLVKTADPTTVSIRHTDGQTISYVTLLEGAAKIVRNR